MLKESILKMLYALGESTVQTFTRINAYEPEEDSEVYRLLKETDDSEE